MKPILGVHDGILAGACLEALGACQGIPVKTLGEGGHPSGVGVYMELAWTAGVGEVGLGHPLVPSGLLFPA